MASQKFTDVRQEQAEREIQSFLRKWERFHLFSIISLPIFFIIYLGAGFYAREPTTEAISEVEIDWSEVEIDWSQIHSPEEEQKDLSEISPEIKNATPAWLDILRPLAKGPCGDPKPSSTDYPLVAYGVASEYTEELLVEIQKYYCTDAELRQDEDGKYIQVASFFNRHRAEDFSRKLLSQVGSGYIHKVVWVTASNQWKDFPLDDCNDMYLEVSQDEVLYSRVFVPYSENLLEEIREKLCRRVLVSNDHIEIARKKKHSVAEKFAVFLKEQLDREIGIEKVKIKKNADDLTVASLRNCEKATSEDYNLFGSKTYSFDFGHSKGIFSFKNSKQSKMYIANEGKAMVVQELELMKCSFGLALVESNPTVMPSGDFSHTYFPDFLFGRLQEKYEWVSCDVPHFYVCKDIELNIAEHDLIDKIESDINERKLLDIL